MLPFLLLLGLPYLFRSTLRAVASAGGGSTDFLGAGPADAAAMAQPGMAPGAPNPMAMHPAGMALTYAMSPQGQKNLKRGVSLIKSAKKGNPKAKKRVAKTRAKARAGDPTAKKEMAVLQTAAALDAETDEEFSDEGDEGDEFE